MKTPKNGSRSLIPALAVGALLLLSAEACGDSDGDPATHPESVADGGDADADEADGASPKSDADIARIDSGDTSPKACNTLTIAGAPVGVQRAVTDPAPTPTGGAIEDGTYFLTEYVIFGRPKAIGPAPFLRSKLVVQGGVWEAVTADPTDATSAKTESIAASTTGTTLTLTRTCDAQPAQSYSYSFLGKELRYYNGKAEIAALIFTKQ